MPHVCFRPKAEIRKSDLSKQKTPLHALIGQATVIQVDKSSCGGKSQRGVLGGFSLRLSIVAGAAACALIAAGCDKLGSTGSSCSSADASAVTLNIIRDEIVRRAAEVGEGDPKILKSKIRASVRQLKLSLADVRTSKDDPNSSKQFCTATVKLVAPAQMVLDADRTREMANLNSVEALADNANVQKEANAFHAEIEFNVQPTDDGDKLFSEIESGEEALAFFGELVQDHLLKNALLDARAEADRLESERNAAISSATQDMQSATLEEARETNRSAVAAINAIWKAIPAVTRQQLLPAQRLWLKKTEAACKLEAAAQATDSVGMEVSRLNCEARAQQERAQLLQNTARQAIDAQYAEPGE